MRRAAGAETMQSWAREHRATNGDAPIVLIVDREEAVRRALARLLRGAGLDVATFASAEELLRYPAPDRPSCAILALHLGGASGLELQERLPREGRQYPVVFVSDHADVGSGVRAMKAGAVDFLVRPLADRALLDVVHRALEHDRRARKDRALRADVQRRFDRLTRRERQVLALVVRGKLNKQIAAELGISEKTVKFHRGRVMGKMQAASVVDLVRLTDRLEAAPAAA